MPEYLKRHNKHKKTPVIICPYVHAHEKNEMREKFNVNNKDGKHLPFFLYHDRKKRGPELSFEHCWNRFPKRDVIIVHSDMSPMPDDTTNQWYERLLEYRDSLPRAGMIACNLYYTIEHNQSKRIQYAGGTYRNGQVSHLYGHIGENGITLDLLNRVREVDWVTFGGVLIRREVIDACGPIDRRYRWAYVMDVDYCLEARLRGFRLYQVPVALQHIESRTTGPMLERSAELQDIFHENFRIFNEKWRSFAPPSIVTPRGE